MLNIKDTVLVLVDVQGKLAEIMHNRDELYANLQKLIKGMKCLDIPIIWMEQIPGKLGQTIQPLRDILTDNTPISKSTFSCCCEPKFMEQLTKLNRKQIILTGIETHVCIYQTAYDLVNSGFHVEVVADAVSSRSAENKTIGLNKINAAGAQITCTETVLLELMRTAEHPMFKEIVKIIK